MNRNARLVAAAVLACAALLALSAWLHSWGGVTLILLGAGALAWYRVQVARGEATEQFFGDMGEETRLTGLQGGASELPVERTLPGRVPPPGVR
jgi:D-arabinose 1-dehydrogenase-like Zn-dependent alcohol dehydrogenase